MPSTFDDSTVDDVVLLIAEVEMLGIPAIRIRTISSMQRLQLGIQIESQKDMSTESMD
jgi:hypothetical protein